MFAAVSSMPGVSARYELDFVPALLVAGLFLCLLLSARLPRRWMRTAVAAVTAGACCWSCAATMALSVNSYGYPLERPNSPLFASIATGLGAGPDALMRDMETLHVDATITFPDAPPGTREAILTTGIYERWDLLMIQYVPGGKAMFAVVHAGVSDTWAPAVALLPGRPRHLTVDYSAAMKRLTARLDGDVALDFPAVFYPTSRDRVTLGKMPAARFDLRAFSGKIEVPVNGIFAAPRR
jgi:hypothetical protein